MVIIIQSWYYHLRLWASPSQVITTHRVTHRLVILLRPSSLPLHIDAKKADVYKAPAKGFPDSSVDKESACKARDLDWIPRLGRSPGEAKGYSLQYSGLENSMDCIDHGVTKSQTWLSDFHFHSSGPGTLQSIFPPNLLSIKTLLGRQKYLSFQMRELRLWQDTFLAPNDTDGKRQKQLWTAVCLQSLCSPSPLLLCRTVVRVLGLTPGGPPTSGGCDYPQYCLTLSVRPLPPHMCSARTGWPRLQRTSVCDRYPFGKANTSGELPTPVSSL